MPREVYADTADYTIEYDGETGAIIHTWDQYVSGQDFRDGANELLEFIRQRDTSKLVVDTSGIQAHDDADKEWLQEEWIPKIIDAGIEYSVTVYADSVISEMEMEEFADQAGDHPYTIVVTGDMSEAREWIAEK